MARFSTHTLLLLASVLSTRILFGGTTYTWTNGNNDSVWNEANNWTPNTGIGYPSATGDVAVFSSLAGSSTVTLGTPITINEINFSYPSGSLTISGTSAIQFDSGGSIQCSTAGTVSINTPINLDATNNPSLTITQSNGTLQIPATNQTTTIGQVSSPGTISYNGPVIPDGIFLAFEGTASNTYTGTTTINSGSFHLAKHLATALQGDLMLLGSSSLVFSSVQGGSGSQFSSSSKVTLDTTGTITLSILLEQQTFGNLIFYAGTFSGTPNFTLMGAGTPLTMRNTTLPGSVTLNVASGGIGNDVFYDATNVGPAILSGVAPTQTFDFGGVARTFNIEHNSSNTVDMQVNPQIKNDGGSGLIKTGGGVLQLIAANIYTGPTTVNAGTLSISSDSNLGMAPSLFLGDASTLQANSTSTLSSTAISLTGTTTGASIDTNSSSFTIGGTSVISSTGTAPLTKINAGTLTLSGANTYTGATIISTGTLALSGTGSIATSSSVAVTGTFDISGVTSSASIVDLSGSGFVTLGSSKNLTLTDPTSTFSGVISDTSLGSLTKLGAGTFTLTGPNTYSGGTTVSGGTLQGNTTSLQGNILNNATLVFDQANDGTYLGSMSGSGSFTKQNSGNLTLSGSNTVGSTSVTGGRLSVNGSLIATGGLTVGSGATLGGTSGAGDAITGVITVNSGGTLSPGNSIGTLNVVGNVNLGAGATFATEINASGAASLLNATGSFNIGSNAMLFVTVDPGVYPASQSYTIVTAASGVTGQFATLTTSLPTFRATVTYPMDEVVLTEIGTIPFSEVVVGGNAGAVATCLDTLNPASGSDMALVQAELRMIPTVEGLALALDELQPSQYTALAIAQENTSLYTSGTIFHRLRETTEICSVPCKPSQKVTLSKKSKEKPANNESCKPEKHLGFWVSPFGGFAYQRNQSNQAGFNTGTGGITTGIDYSLARHWSFGGAIGYSYEHLNWKEDQGYANMQNGYGALYGSFYSKYAYMLGALMGSYNHYNTARNISFGNGVLILVDRTAKGSHNGWQGSGHLQGGLLFGKKVQFSPFAQADYIFVHEKSFKEHGAKSLNLRVQNKNSDFLDVEGGIQVSRCFSMSKNKVSPSLGISGIREWRFMGKRTKSSFAGSSCTMTTHGMNPDRRLLSASCGLTFLFPDENQTLSLDYKGKWGEHFQDNRVLAQFLIKF